jgi:hypothetical protein
MSMVISTGSVPLMCMRSVVAAIRAAAIRASPSTAKKEIGDSSPACDGGAKCGGLHRRMVIVSQDYKNGNGNGKFTCFLLQREKGGRCAQGTTAVVGRDHAVRAYHPRVVNYLLWTRLRANEALILSGMLVTVAALGSFYVP